MANIGGFPVSTDVLLVGGAVIVLGVAVYEFLKPTNTTITPSQTTNPQTNPVNTPTTTNNPAVIYTPAITPANSQSATVGSGSYYAIDYSPVSTYAPYTSTYNSSTSNTSITKSSSYSPQNTYTASGFGSSVYGQGAKTNTNQPLSSVL